MKYDELNKYLNDVCVYLNNTGNIIINNMSGLCEYNDGLYKCLYDYKFDKKNKKNNLTYDDVYMLTREIIESINPAYLKKYDELMNSGSLDFSYENEYNDCEFVHIERNNDTYSLININREFNYDDVINLVHEFIHYTNDSNNCTRNRDLLTEFLSIYFETYAIEYLINKGINKDEVDYEIRLKSTFYRANNFYYVESPLLCFMNIGSINDENYEFFKKRYFPIERSAFDQECNCLLNKFRNIENNYCVTHFQDDFNYDELIKKYARFLVDHFKYLFGTILSMYAFKYCKMEDILYLNEHINDDDSADMVELLKNALIDLNNDSFLDDALESIKDYLKRYDSVKVVI